LATSPEEVASIFSS